MPYLVLTSGLATLIFLHAAMGPTVLGATGLGCITGIMGGLVRTALSVFRPMPGLPLPTPLDVATVAAFGTVTTVGAMLGGEAPGLVGFNLLFLGFLGGAAYLHVERGA